jgi:hypothetical protein
MRRVLIYGLTLATVSAAAACGGKIDEARQAATQAREAAKSMEQFAKSMEQQPKGADGQTSEPVAFSQLQAFLPDLSGWEKGKPEGESMSAPVKYSEAKTRYTKDESAIELKVVDTAMSQLLTLPYQMFLASNYSKESGTGYEKAVKIGGNPGWEKWDSEAKRAEIGVIVGKRFLVTVEGSDTDMKTVQGVLGKMDLSKLAGLK